MVCTICLNKPEFAACQFSLDEVLENIRKHYKSIENKLAEKSKQVDELKERNNKLMKAIDCLKKPNVVAQLNFSQNPNSQQVRSSFFAPQLSPPVPSPVFDDITIIDDEEEDKELISVMDTALNGSALNASINNDVITETENPTMRPSHIRRLALKSRSKISHQNKPYSNDENKKPAAVSSPPPLTEVTKPSTTGLPLTSKQKPEEKQKEVLFSGSKSKTKRLALKQTKLPFDEKREYNTNVGIPTRTMSLGRFERKKSPKLKIDEDIFDFNKPPSFQFKSPSPKKSKLKDSKVNFFSPQKTPEQSLMIIPSPTRTIYFLDDTIDEEQSKQTGAQQQQTATDKALGNKKTDSLSDFNLPSVNARNIQNQMKPTTLTPPADKPTDISGLCKPPTKHIKEEPLTQQATKKAINPIFKYTENTEEESDDEFMVRPIQIKIEPEPEKRIDIDKIKCQDCRNYIKFCGDRMTAEKLEEHIRNCINHNKQDQFIAETPEGFWNPLLLSFDADDPRNEVLIDDRFSKKKT